MIRPAKHRRIILLMIISQLLLTLFVIQWLRSQYQTTREKLHEDLDVMYIDAQDELIDTLLFRTYVNPVIGVIKDTVVLAERIEKDINWKGEKGRITIRVNSETDSFRHISDTIKLRRRNDDMLMRSMKLIISHSRDSSERDSNQMINFHINPDTTVFIDHFTRRLEDAGMKFSLAWEKEETDSTINKGKHLLIDPLTPFSLPSVAVSDFKGYISGKILPQIIFGIALVLITALAFLLSYRSIREHLVFNDLRNEFISNMTHELKTPVATIGIALESLSKYNMKEKPEVMEEYLRLAFSETKRLDELISRVLDHSLLEEKKSEGKFTETDLNNLVSDVAASMKPRLGNRGNIDLAISSGRIMVVCDQLLMRGVFFNLIDNSIKYSGQTPEIKIRTRIEGSSAIVEINDNGPGIPAEYREKIFEKFFRLPSADVHNVKGYGLGLSFASLVIKLHRGTIEVKNLNPGCSFILKIPVV